MNRSRILGERKLKKTLRRIEPNSRSEITEAFEEGAEAIYFDQLRLVAKDTKALAFALRKHVSKNGMLARVGLITPKLQRQFYYARFLEQGTKGYPKKNIPPMRPQPFITPSFDLNREWILQRVQKGIGLALVRATK